MKKLSLFCVVEIIFSEKCGCFLFWKSNFKMALKKKKKTIFDLLFTFLVTRGKTQKFLQHISHLYTYTYFAHSIDFFAFLHYEIFTLKTTVKFFVTLKRHRNHTEKYLQRKPQWLSRIISQKYFPLLFKDTEITLKKFKSHWKICSVTHFFCSLVFQRYSRDFQCDFQCHNFVVLILQKLQIYHVWFIFIATLGVDSYSLHFGATNK